MNHMHKSFAFPSFIRASFPFMSQLHLRPLWDRLGTGFPVNGSFSDAKLRNGRVRALCFVSVNSLALGRADGCRLLLGGGGFSRRGFCQGLVTDEKKARYGTSSYWKRIKSRKPGALAFEEVGALVMDGKYPQEQNRRDPYSEQLREGVLEQQIPIPYLRVKKIGNDK